jgi:carbon-monoxide dehydrogenase medium subunit
MYPPPFDYFAPTTLEETLDLLARYGDEAKVLAGGQSLLPLMKLRLASPSYLIDINRLPGLDVLDDRPGSGLRVGALVRHKTLERSDLVHRRYPTVAACAPLVADPLVRNLGTLVGSVCHADPQGDWGAVVLALDGHIVARSLRGERRIPASEFFVGPLTTVLQPDEMVTEVHLPDPGPRVFGTYFKLERKVGDFATVGVAVHLSFQDGRVASPGIGLTAVGPTSLRARRAEALLRGQRLSEALILEAARTAAQEADPSSDVRGSAEYKRQVVRVFVTRALRQALAAQPA